ncbi:DUF3426 domain-containing protein [Herbaspirillum sp. RV1423]|uniref:DUF3426 domain-containing protein n=1 Tax=Herbaspirillum sp. RV1423 TaxID=1443993 RepID=UPI0004AD717E|nr:DUF3426 domain-containing protein [Herbaspirillum sp. RV1423]
MALATQCPFCQTTFRVAQDQLKLRGGLVRCGNCKEVFNGNDHLVSPEIASQLVAAPAASQPGQRTAPTGWPPLPGGSLPRQAEPDVAPASAAGPAAPPPWMATPDLSSAFASIAAETKDAPWGTQSAQDTLNEPSAPASPPLPEQIAASPEPFPLAGTPTTQSPTPGQADDVAAGPMPSQPEVSINTLTQELSYPIPLTSSAPLEEQSDPITAGPIDDASSGNSQAGDEYAQAAEEEKPEAESDDEDTEEIAEEETEDEEDTPAFVQKAERRERLHRIARLVMGIGAVVLSIALLLQATYVWRNTIVAWLPSTRPLLSSACAALHCAVGLPTNIDQLVLESSELQLVPPNQNIYTLSVLLHNRGYGAQAWPYLELTLNDADEKAITRRVFTPREYLDRAQNIDNGLAGESEQQIKLTFELAQPAASGYRIYLFYP